MFWEPVSQVKKNGFQFLHFKDARPLTKDFSEAVHKLFKTIALSNLRNQPITRTLSPNTPTRCTSKINIETQPHVRIKGAKESAPERLRKSQKEEPLT